MDQDQEDGERPGRTGMAVAILILENPYGRLREDDIPEDEGISSAQEKNENIFASLEEFLKAIEEQKQIEQFERLNSRLG